MMKTLPKKTNVKEFRLFLQFIAIVIIFTMTGCSPKAEIPAAAYNIELGEELSIPIDFLVDRKYRVSMASSDECVLIQTGENCFVGNAPGSAIVYLKHGNKIIDTCSVEVCIPIQRAKFDCESIVVDVGDRVDPSYAIWPENATNQMFELVSDNPDCLIELEDGALLATAEGVANITLLQEETVYDKCSVIINNVPAEEISFSDRELEVLVGREQELQVIFIPENTTFKNVEIQSTNVKCLEIQPTEDPDVFILKGLIPGTTNLTASTTDGLKATIQVKVVPVVLDNLSVTVNNNNILIGNVERVRYSFLPEDVTDKAVTFRSNNGRVASVDKDGNIKAVGIGTAEITVIHNKSQITETIRITVKPVEVSSVRIKQNDFSAYPNERKQLEAVVNPSNATYPKVTWSSSNESVATVSANGYVTTRKAGTATITAKTENGKSDSIYLTVKPTTRNFTVHVTATCSDYNNVGNEWGKYFYVNNRRISSGGTVSVTVNQNISVRTEIIEFDSVKDIGASTYTLYVPTNYFERGFYITQTIAVRENRGDYVGNVAYWDIRYNFIPS